MQQISSHTFVGLQLDTSVSKCSPLYLIDAHNIRITARDGLTLLSVTNERGPKELTILGEYGNMNILGTIVGHCVLNNYLVLFIHNDSTDLILRIDMSYDKPKVVSLFTGNTSLGFDPEHPIEAIGDYENENILKVYWTDGVNLPRLINIANKTNGEPRTYSWKGSFDFVPELQLNEEVKVTKNINTSGSFPAGVIQYAFTYYNKYGLETNIFHTTPLLYISYIDRGGSPESKISNSFTIEVNGLDKHFEYLRIYSILRTSIDGIPIVKRVLDINISELGNTATYTDTGTEGSDVESTHLLYVGGEEITAETLCHKDGTLFLGGINIKRPVIPPEVKAVILELEGESNKDRVSTSYLEVFIPKAGNTDLPFANGLNAKSEATKDYADTTAGFKNREYYRLGILFLYKNGKWSEPCFIKDYLVNINNYPLLDTESYDYNAILKKIIMNYTIPDSIVESLTLLGYKKYRPIIVMPELLDRTIIALGVINPTMYTFNHRNTDKDLYALSSWFFREYGKSFGAPPSLLTMVNTSTGAASPLGNTTSLMYTNQGDWKFSAIDGAHILRTIEIEGNYDNSNKFAIDWNTVTFHSPELIFDDSIINTSLDGIYKRCIGLVAASKTLSDINILTSTPTINGNSSGFIHKSFSSDGSQGILSGLFYEDYLVEDYGTDLFRKFKKELSPVKWLIYPWQLSGSLNNDCNRPANSGIRSSELLKKIISNLRYYNTTWSNAVLMTGDYQPLVFYSDEVNIVKLGNNTYMGNIDTMLNLDNLVSKYFCFDKFTSESSYNDMGSSTLNVRGINTPFTSNAWWRTYSPSDSETTESGIYKYYGKKKGWDYGQNYSAIGNEFLDLVLKKEGIRMKYKSTPHVVMNISGSTGILLDNEIPIVELYRGYDSNITFGGQTEDAKRANLWIPAGKAVPIALNSLVKFSLGDTWYSRFDCMKTYPFTPEDPNLIVEIGSFMLETHINIDGRYDRNRGLLNNLNMTPQNFNLFNPVYSLKDNYFNYRILDNSYYELNSFPTLITWSTEKLAGSDIDPWTSVTLSSTYDVDGSKGKISGLNTWKDTIYCFLDNGISQILFNSRVLIPTNDNIPIEIASSYKVDGKRYISDGTGCLNKYSICNTPAAVYFIDSVSKHLYSISDNGLMDLSVTKSTTSWFRSLNSSKWTANNFSTRVFHDSNHSDLYVVTKDECLCFNEILGEFTSYMSYYDIPIMFNVINKFFCVKNNYINEMFTGDYNYFFGLYEPYDLTFIVNGISLNMVSIDKIFTNIDFRADRWSDELDSILSPESPFDYIRVWNEYLDTGETLLKNLRSRPSNLKKKFRTWRIDIPRSAYNRRDRIRNNWCKVKIGSAPRYRNGNDGFILLHDLNVTYYV